MDTRVYWLETMPMIADVRLEFEEFQEAHR
jgi:hypothetical protein